MSGREVGWGLFLAGLPFAPFVFYWADLTKFDISHAQGAWGYAGLVGVWALAMSSRSTQPIPLNRPLACLLLWTGLHALFQWSKAIIVHQLYPMPLLMGFIPLLIPVIFYQSALQVWDVEIVRKLGTWLAVAGVVVMSYSLLQLAGLDQLFTPLDPAKSNKEFVGTLGNPSNYGGYLALLLPLLLWKPSLKWRLASLLCAVLIFVSKSSTALLAGFLGLYWYSWFRDAHRKWWLSGCGLLGLAAFSYVALNPGWLNVEGRLTAWREFWKLFAAQPLTGLGPGFVHLYSRTITDTASPIFQWRHVHNEALQLLVEIGVVGTLIVGWGAVSLGRLCRKIHRTPEWVACTGLLIAFIPIALLSFPLHQWVPATMAGFAYCGLHVLARGT